MYVKLRMTGLVLTVVVPVDEAVPEPDAEPDEDPPLDAPEDEPDLADAPELLTLDAPEPVRALFDFVVVAGLVTWAD